MTVLVRVAGEHARAHRERVGGPPVQAAPIGVRALSEGVAALALDPRVAQLRLEVAAPKHDVLALGGVDVVDVAVEGEVPVSRGRRRAVGDDSDLDLHLARDRDQRRVRAGVREGRGSPGCPP
jgi:hypothetical protein